MEGLDVPCASYSRYSSEQQREESIQDQQRKCREFAERNSHQISPELEFADQAVSGTKLHRDGLDAMLSAAAAGSFRVLYFHNLSRLARESVITMPMLKKLVYVDKVRIISVTEGIDSDRDGWEMVATIFSVLHERYIKDLSANVFRGQEGTVLAGWCVGDYCFGYTSVPIPGSEQGRNGRHAKPRMVYALDDATAPWVIRIFHWFVVERRSVRSITRELNRLGAPKDHRATTKHWHHQYVTGLLGNEKYIGTWPWGKDKNVRNPLTGQVSQEERPEEEWKQWTRKLPHLQIITDDMFAKAQEILAANRKKLENRRLPDGKLAGSKTGNSATHPRHLLSGLLRCAGEKCGATFRVSGTKGKYLGCPNYPRGLCTCKTQIARDRAERMILDVIGKRILSNPAWHQMVLEETLAARKAENQSRPDEIQNLERARSEVDRKIDRLVDSIENGTSTPEIRERLAERRKERELLAKRLDELHRTTEKEEEPTAEWVAVQLQNLAQTLRGGGPAAALALRSLVGGHVLVKEIQEPGRKRFFVRASFTIQSQHVLKTMGASSSKKASGGDLGHAGFPEEEITIDFREPLSWADEANRAKELYDQGLMNLQIAAVLGCPPGWVTKLLKHWFRSHGIDMLDGRTRRSTLAKKQMGTPLYEKLAEPATALWNEGMADVQIAARLGCSPPTAVAAVEYYHRLQGLEVPSHSARRATLVDRMKHLFDEGLLLRDIAREVGMCSRSVTLLLQERFEALGQEMPDGRTRRHKLPVGDQGHAVK